jgi:hypothetical protein
MKMIYLKTVQYEHLWFLCRYSPLPEGDHQITALSVIRYNAGRTGSKSMKSVFDFARPGRREAIGYHSMCKVLVREGA